MGNCAGMGMYGPQNMSLAQVVYSMLSYTAWIGSQLLVFLTSGPVLGFLLALILLLIVVALMKFIFFRDLRRNLVD